jgi:hypothetical protein
MQVDINAKEQNQATLQSPMKGAGNPRSAKLIECPFEVRIDGVVHDQFYNVRDALASARAVTAPEGAFRIRGGGASLVAPRA